MLKHVLSGAPGASASGAVMSGWRVACTLAMALSLAGCDLRMGGIRPDREGMVTDRFEVASDLLDAREDAIANVTDCDKFPYTVTMLPSDQGARVDVVAELAGEREVFKRIELTALPPGPDGKPRTQVSTTGLGVGYWDTRNLTALRQSVLTKKVVCRADVPRG